MAHDVTDSFNTPTEYWVYDSDADFAAFPGALSSEAGSTEISFQGGPLFDEWPHTVQNAFPFKFRHTVRCVCEGSENTSLWVCTFGRSADFSGDYGVFIFFYSALDLTYQMELFGVQGGAPFDRVIDTGIPLFSDHDFVFDFEIQEFSYRVDLPEFDQGDFLNGFSFPTLGYMTVNLQHHDADNRAMLLESRIYTEKPSEVVPPLRPAFDFNRLSYAGDIRLFLEEGVGGVRIFQNDLVRDAGLETAALISLFSDRRADSEDALPDSSRDLRGWWGDATQGDKIGSRLWLLSRSKMEEGTLTDAELFSKEALQWMVDDGLADSVEAGVTRRDTYTLEISITIIRPQKAQSIAFKYFFNWDAQSLKRGN